MTWWSLFDYDQDATGSRCLQFCTHNWQYEQLGTEQAIFNEAQMCASGLFYYTVQNGVVSNGPKPAWVRFLYLTQLIAWDIPLNQG